MEIASLKQILKYLIISTVLMTFPTYINRILPFIPLLVAIWAAKINNINIFIIFIILWTYIYNFYIDYGYLSTSGIASYLADPKLYIVIVLVVNYKKVYKCMRYDRLIYVWIACTMIFTLFSDIVNAKISINLFTYPVVIMYYILVSTIYNINSKYNLMSLLLAIGILQLVVSILQVYQIIDSPSMSRTMSYYSYSWEPGLDDVASGTIGAGKSNVTSWIGTILFSLLFSYGIEIGKLTYYVIAPIFLLQYSTVDSKTALGITGFVTMIVILKYAGKIATDAKKFMSIVFIALSTLAIKQLVDIYYTNVLESQAGIEGRMEFVESNIQVILEDIYEWGKIRGFVEVSNLLLEEGPSKVLFGIGRGNYVSEGYRNMVESMDIQVMQRSNITRSRSTFITMYAEQGITGVLILIGMIAIIRGKLIKLKARTNIGRAMKISLLATLYGSVLFMFLYGGHKMSDLAFVMQGILLGYVINYEAGYNKYAMSNMTSSLERTSPTVYVQR